MAFNKSIPNFLGGKTQEPFTQRQDNELEEEINCFNSVNKGLIRRTGSYIVNDLDMTSNDILNLNKIEYKDGFLIIDENKNVSFFKKDGTKYVTSFESLSAENNFTSYLSGETDIGFLNQNDLTYLYNSNKKTSVIEVVTDDNLDENFYVVVKYPNNDTTTTIKVEYEVPSYAPGETNFVFTSRVNSTSASAERMAQMIPEVGSGVTQGQFRNKPYFYTSPSILKWVRGIDINIGGAGANISFDLTITGDVINEDTEATTLKTTTFTIPSGSTTFDLGTDKYINVKKVEYSSPLSIDSHIQNSFSNSSYVASYQFPAGATLVGERINITPYSNILKITNENFTIPGDSIIKNVYVDDNSDNFEIESLYKEVSDVSLLPSSFFHKSKIKITGNPSEDEDDYHVIFETTGASTDGIFGKGVWREAGTDNFQLDLSTMPFSLIINDETQTVLINDGGWTERLVGDILTNKDPYFLNHSIKDMFIYGSRLCVLSGGDKIDLSGTNDFFNFYRTTVTTTLESDRISVTINSDKLINLTRSVSFNESVLLIDDDTQFIMNFEGGLSINTLQVNEVSSFNTKSKIKPLRTNDSLFFISNYSNNSQVIKFSSRDISLVQGLEVTEKIRSLIPNEITSTCTNNANDMLFLHKKNSNKVFLYSYKVFAGEGEYGSWCELDFDGYNILYIDCIDDELFVFCNSADNLTGVRLLKINLSNDTTFENGFENESFRIHIDKKEIVNIKDDVRNIDGLGNQKQFLVVPYNVRYDLINPDNIRVIATGENGKYFKFGHGYSIVAVDEDINGNTIITIENPRFDISISDSKYIIDDVLVGEVFQSRAKLSKVNLKNRDGLPLNSGTTLLLGINLTFGSTGGFILNTEITNAGSYDEVFTGKIVGTRSAVIGEVNVESGSKTFYLGADKNEIETEIRNLDYLPFEIQSGEYEIEYDSITSTY